MIPDQKHINIFNNLFIEKKPKEDNLVAVHFRTKDYDIKLKDNYYLDSLKDFGNNFEYHIFGDDIDYLEKKVPELFKYLNYIFDKQSRLFQQLLKVVYFQEQFPSSLLS